MVGHEAQIRSGHTVRDARTPEAAAGRGRAHTSKLLAPATLVFALTLAAFAREASAAEYGEPAIDSSHVMAMAHRGQSFVRPRAIVVDAAHQEIAVANTGLGRIEYFDFRTWPRGYFTHVVPDPNGRGRAGEPFALALDGQDRLFISDLYVSYVDVVDFRGRSLAHLTLPAPDDSASGETGPGALAIAPDGRILVASRGKHGRIHVFDSELRHVKTFGTAGKDPGELSVITSLAVDAGGRTYVACGATQFAVQIFDADGRYLSGFGVHEIGPGNFSFPSAVTLTADGRVWVADAIRQLVQVFDPNGKYLGAVGGSGNKPGEFTEPSALAGDGHGILALTEKSGGRFQVMWTR